MLLYWGRRLPNPPFHVEGKPETVEKILPSNQLVGPNHHINPLPTIGNS